MLDNGGLLLSPKCSLPSLLPLSLSPPSLPLLFSLPLSLAPLSRPLPLSLSSFLPQLPSLPPSPISPMPMSALEARSDPR